MHDRLALATLVLLAVTATGAGAQVEGASDLHDLLALPVTSASRLEQTSLRAPASLTLITAEQIQRFGYRTLAEALSSVPGLYITYDRNYSYAGVRGFSRETDYNTRVLVLVNGYRLNEDVYGYAPLGTDLPIDLDAVDRIEVVRGPGSVTFGTGALLAVINVILREPGSIGRSAVAAEAGSRDHLALDLHGGGETRRGLGFAWSLRGSRARGGDLYYAEYADETASGRTRGTDDDENRGATAILRWRDLTVTALATTREKGIPTGAWETAFADRRARTQDGWTILGVRWERALGKRLAISLGSHAGHYAYDGVYPYGPSDGEVFFDTNDNTWWGNDLQVRWEQSPSHRLIVGAESRDNRRADYRTRYGEGPELFASDQPFRVRSLYLEDELQIGEDFVLTAGVRHDDNPWTGGSTNPRLALVYLPGLDTSVKLLYGRAFRAPNLYETVYDDSYSAAKGNLELRPEVVHTAELVAQRRLTEHVLLESSLFYSRLEDLIDQRIDPRDGLRQYQNAADAHSRGVELRFDVRCCGDLLAFGSATYQRTRDGRTGARLTNSPSTLVKAGLSTTVVAPWRLGAELVHESGRRTLQGTSTDPFLLAHGLLTWRPRPELSLELRVRNLFDTAYAYPAGFEHRQAAIAQDGRTFTVRCAARF
jgi:iron complex outermembrane receptor protein